MFKLLISILLLFFIHKLEAQVDIDAFNKVLIAKEKDSSNVVSEKKYGLITDLFLYNSLINEKFNIGGYSITGTYKFKSKSTIGLCYEYSIFNKSVLLDIRQEISKMHIKPIIFADLGYSLQGNKQNIRSKLGIQQEVQSKQNIVFKIGIGGRMYLSKKLPYGLNFGLFYKNEPGFELSESKSGIILINNYDNIGSLCLFFGISI